MQELRIVCTEQIPISQPTSHAHIVSVGIDTNNDGLAEENHDLNKVVLDINNKTSIYYTYGHSSKKIALVEVIDCPTHCGEKIIRSTPDAVIDNNLDSFRRCNWIKR
jgi:hypothetical protein